MPIQIVRMYASLVMMMVGLQLAGDKEEHIIVIRVILSVAILFLTFAILGNF